MSRKLISRKEITNDQLTPHRPYDSCNIHKKDKTLTFVDTDKRYIRFQAKRYHKSIKQHSQFPIS